MHKDPERRYSSVEALIRDIDHYLRSEPLEAQRDTLRYRARKFIARNRRAVTAAAAVLTLVLGMAAFFTVRLAIARNRALAETARTQRIQRFMLNLFEGGDKESGPADNLRVITMLDRGVLEAQDLNNEPAVQADLYQTLGSIYQKLGKLDRADSLLNSALERRISLFGKDSVETADSLVALGLAPSRSITRSACPMPNGSFREETGHAPSAVRRQRQSVARQGDHRSGPRISGGTRFL